MANNQQGGHRGGSGNFAEDREKASEAGRKGGEHSHGGSQASGHQPHSSQAGSGSQRGGSGNSAENRDKASEAGKKGGSH